MTRFGDSFFPSQRGEFPDFYCVFSTLNFEPDAGRLNTCTKACSH